MTSFCSLVRIGDLSPSIAFGFFEGKEGIDCVLIRRNKRLLILQRIFSYEFLPPPGRERRGIGKRKELIIVDDESNFLIVRLKARGRLVISETQKTPPEK